MREVVEAIRLRYQECRPGDVSLEVWRSLQLQILDAAKKLQRKSVEREQAGRTTSAGRAALWGMLGESFWLERDVARLATMIDGVIVALEHHDVIA